MSKRYLHMMEKLSSSAKLCYVKSLCICCIVLVCSVFFVCFRFSSGIHGSTAADSVQSGWPVVESNGVVSKARCLRALAQLTETKTLDIWKKSGERLRCASRRYRRHIMEIQL
ncbi:hypothetical protein TNCV_3256171 [Trichonephila clavipes]|nr:hypothetical protein TNCV_3256171 [Trichonephila clavipes]